MYADKIAKEEGIDKILHAKKEEVALLEATKTEFWDNFLEFRESFDAIVLLASFAGNLSPNNMTKEEIDAKLKEYKEEKHRAWSQSSHFRNKIQPHIGQDDPNDYRQVDYWDREANAISSKIAKLRETSYNSDAEDSLKLMNSLKIIIEEKIIKSQLTIIKLKNLLSKAKQEYKKNESSSQLYLYFLVVQEIVSKTEHFDACAHEEMGDTAAKFK